ncbi:hypothetical protein [Niallia endozanthoxylica]|uniref:Uncharacterized protein n=1 Tax=Niallia endozanthoxylica TaxID=2036016 RepID=A0A5J5HBM2_9BACI|nr:hypothetical protein [Niallia endozanthoxylica]KAA9016962.1 hypothetical protein F4V44_21065 [Niallia endozanthoxylica]
MEKLIKLITNFLTDYKESANRYGAARLAVHEGLLAQNKDINLLNNYIEYQHGSSANSPR